MIEEDAQTCDGCGELKLQESLRMNEKTKLIYCQECIKEQEAKEDNE